MKAITTLAIILVIIGLSFQEIAAQPSYPLTIRGGGNLRTWLQETENPSIVKVKVQFEFGTRPAGAGLRPGQGSWLDRGMRPGEPIRLEIFITDPHAANRLMQSLSNPAIFYTFNCFNTGKGYLRCSQVPTAQGQAASDPEIKQILAAAKIYAKDYGGTEDKFDFRFVKKVNNYALVVNHPKPKYEHQFEGAQIVLKKINGKWVGQEMGSNLDDWHEKIPELFK